MMQEYNVFSYLGPELLQMQMQMKNFSRPKLMCVGVWNKECLKEVYRLLIRHTNFFTILYIQKILVAWI